MFDAAYARRVFDYDPLTGAIYWKIQTGPRAKVGERVGRVREKDGYRQVMHMGRMILEHRLAWLLHHGAWPENELDHRDGQRANNAIANLREATRTENNRNALKKARHLPKGVTEVEGGRFKASIVANRKRHALGVFDTVEEASETYQSAALYYHGEFSGRVA